MNKVEGKGIGFKLLVVILALVFDGNIIISAGTKFITCSDYNCLCQGEIDGIAISNNGEIILSSAMTSRIEIPEAVVWAMVSDGNNIFIGTGHEGKVYKYTIANNSLGVIYDSEEMEVMALAIDKNNELYIGTSPNGKIYKMNKNGEVSVYAEIPEKNIYAMLMDKTGNLIVGTGENGRVYRIAKNGEAEVLMDTSETNITFLQLSEGGSILAGSYPNGILYKIDGKDSFVIYDSDYDQISSIISKGNNWYIAGVSIAELSAGMQPQVLPPKGISIDISSSEQSASGQQQVDTQKLQQQQMLFMKGKKLTRTSAIFKIDKDIRINKLYSSDENTVISMVGDDQSDIIYSTSPDNSLLLMRENGDYYLIFKGKGVVSNLMKDKRGIWFATSSPSYLYKIDDAYGKKGVYESKVFDTMGISSWGKIKWFGKAAGTEAIKCYTRSGNTSVPDENWSKWSKAYLNSEGENIESPKARFIQYKCELNSQDGKTSPILRDVSISYLEQNQKPSINKIELLPGTVYEKMQSIAENKEQSTNIQIAGIKVMPPSMQSAKTMQGWLTIKWEANDPNNDELIFDLYYADQTDMNWKVLKKDIKDNFYSFDTTMLPDGEYKFKVEVSDRISNTKENALSDYKVTDKYFSIDNTQPIIKLMDLKNAEGKLVINFKVEDEVSIIDSVEYASDLEHWYKLNPIDYVLDSKIEQFELKIDKDYASRNIVVIRARDKAGNVATKSINYKKE